MLLLGFSPALLLTRSLPALNNSLSSSVAHGKSAPLSLADPHPAVIQPHYRGAHRKLTHTLLIITTPLNSSLSPSSSRFLSHAHARAASWADPAIVGADPFLQNPHTNLSFSRERGSARTSEGVKVKGGGWVRRDTALLLIALNQGGVGVVEGDDHDEGMEGGVQKVKRQGSPEYLYLLI